MTQVIDIVVTGPTGSGKSHVLSVLASALRGEYGMHAQITSHELSMEKNLGHELLKPRVADTIFNLREQGSASSGKYGALNASIDTSDLTSAPDKIQAVQGEAISFALDPTESAIRETVELLRDHSVFLAETTMSQAHRDGIRFLGEKLNSHLNHLMAAQLKRLAAG